MHRIFVAGLLLLSTGNALAQTEGTRTVYKPITRVDLSEIQIDGEGQKPAMTWIESRKKTRFKNMIHIRGNFRDELNATVPAL